jgi:hypothetical protein
MLSERKNQRRRKELALDDGDGTTEVGTSQHPQHHPSMLSERKNQRRRYELAYAPPLLCIACACQQPVHAELSMHTLCPSVSILLPSPVQQCNAHTHTHTHTHTCMFLSVRQSLCDQKTLNTTHTFPLTVVAMTSSFLQLGRQLQRGSKGETLVQSVTACRADECRGGRACCGNVADD